MKFSTLLKTLPPVFLAVFFASCAKQEMVEKPGSEPVGWVTSVDEGVKLAKEQNKAVLVEFTGSDWCPPCIKMRKEVFSKEEFVQGASENFVLVEIDVPRGNKALEAKNKPVAEQFQIRGYPTVVLLTSDGVEFTRFIASDHPTVDAFLAHLDKSLEEKLTH